MIRRLLLAAALLFSLAAAGHAEIMVYPLRGDSSTLFPTDGTILRPGSVSGNVVIEDPGNGTPILQEFDLVVDWSDTVGSSSTSGIPGTTVSLRSVHELSVTPGQAGVGSTEGSIAWGSLTGWSQTGFLLCRTICPGGCPTGVSMCVPFVGFEGLGANAPISASSYDTGPWAFSVEGLAFDAESLEFVNLSGGVVTFSALWEGTLTHVPILPALGLGALSLGLAAWGAAALRRGR